MIKDIGGLDRSFKFNQMAMQEFSLNYGRHEKLATENPELFILYNAFHAGLTGSYKAKCIEVDFTFSDVIDMVDGLYEDRRDEEVKSVITALSSARIWQDTVEKMAENSEEKKSQPMKKLKSQSQPMKKLKNTGESAGV